MIKHFCDVCGQEVEWNLVTHRLKDSSVIQGTKVEVEIIVGISGVWNKGDLCKSCLYRVLDRFDPREKAANAA